MAHLVTAVKGIILDLRSFTRSCDDIGIVRGKFFGILLTRGQNAYAFGPNRSRVNSRTRVLEAIHHGGARSDLKRRNKCNRTSAVIERHC
jgi:hypothetical protein